VGQQVPPQVRRFQVPETEISAEFFAQFFCRFGNSEHFWKNKGNLLFVLTLFLSTLVGSIMSNYTKCKAAVIEKRLI
jgi:hypothetical protein